MCVFSHKIITNIVDAAYYKLCLIVRKILPIFCNT